MQPPAMPRMIMLTHSICLSMSWVFLLGCSLTAPAFKYSGFMSYNNQFHSYYFGVFGYCENYGRICRTEVGYSIYGLFRQAQGENGASEALNITYSYLTKYLLLIPVACVITFGAWIITMRQSRHGKILFSSAIACFVAFSFSLASLVMEELLFQQLYNDSKQVKGSRVRWGSPRYLLMFIVLSTLVATITGFIAAVQTRNAAGTSRGAAFSNFSFGGNSNSVPLQSYVNVDKQDQAGLLAHSAPPGRSGSPGPFENPYDGGYDDSRGHTPQPYQDRPYDSPQRPSSPPGPARYDDPYDDRRH